MYVVSVYVPVGAGSDAVFGGNSEKLQNIVCKIYYKNVSVMCLFCRLNEFVFRTKSTNCSTIKIIHFIILTTRIIFVIGEILIHYSTVKYQFFIRHYSTGSLFDMTVSGNFFKNNTLIPTRVKSLKNNNSGDSIVQGSKTKATKLQMKESITI